MSNRKMWFGTEQYMQWIETPQSGADSTPEEWAASGTLLNGGGYVNHSWGSHKTYNFSWSNTATREAAQTMKSYRDGSYGRGLLYFVSPLIYDTNVLPARWASPSMATQDEGFGHIYSLTPKALPVTGFEKNRYPVETASYTVPARGAQYDERSALFIPIPPGMTLWIGAVYEATGGLGVHVRTDSGTDVTVPPVGLSDDVVAPLAVTGKFARLWFGSTGLTPGGTLNVTAVTARLAPTDNRSWTSHSVNPSASSGSTFGWGGVDSIAMVSGEDMFVPSSLVTAPVITAPSSGFATVAFQLGGPGTTTVTVNGLDTSFHVPAAGGEYKIPTTVNADDPITVTFDGPVTNYRVGFGTTQANADRAAFDLNTASTHTMSYAPGTPIEFGRNLPDGGTDVSNVTFVTEGSDVVAYYTPMVATPEPLVKRGPWVGGQGHSGVRFDGAPTYVEYTGVNKGQIGYSATFREVGDSTGRYF